MDPPSSLSLQDLPTRCKHDLFTHIYKSVLSLAASTIEPGIQSWGRVLHRPMQGFLGRHRQHPFGCWNWFVAAKYTALECSATVMQGALETAENPSLLPVVSRVRA